MYSSSYTGSWGIMRTAVLCTTTNDLQSDKETIHSQVELATEYCKLHQLTVNDWYLDEAIMGPIPLKQRPEGLRLFDNVKSGMIDLLLIHRLDHLGRKASEILDTVAELEQAGVSIRSMTEPFDTKDPSGRFMLSVLAEVAELEKETKMERMWHGANRVARSGKWLGGIVPYGYRVNEKGFLEINEAKLPNCQLSEAEVIRTIYRMTTEEHLSTLKIADYLNGLNVPPSYVKEGRQVKKGKHKENTSGIWRPGRIRSMIVNPTYKGRHSYGKRTKKQREIITRQVPAIVTEQDWNYAQVVLKENRNEAMSHPIRQYLLSGLIKCGNCGRNYCGTAYKNKSSKGGMLSYYKCNGKIKDRIDGIPCDSKNVSGTWLENKVTEAIKAWMKDPHKIIEQLRTTTTKETLGRDQLIETKKQLETAVLNKEIEKVKILDLYRKNLITGGDVEGQLTKIAAETISLTERIAEIDEILNTTITTKELYGNIEQILIDLKDSGFDNLEFEERRKIVRLIVDEIIIHTGIINGKKQVDAEIIYSIPS